MFASCYIVIQSIENIRPFIACDFFIACTTVHIKFLSKIIVFFIQFFKQYLTIFYSLSVYLLTHHVSHDFVNIFRHSVFLCVLISEHCITSVFVFLRFTFPGFKCFSLLIHESLCAVNVAEYLLVSFVSGFIVSNNGVFFFLVIRIRNHFDKPGF